MEAEDLAKRWERLHLSEEERSCFHVKQDLSKEEDRRGKHCIVGRAMTEKGINSEAFRITMSQIWRLEGWVRFKELGDQCFLIEFQTLADKEKIFSGHPWFFDRHLLTLLEVDGIDSISELHFAYEPFWVQLHNLPLATMTEELGEQFTASIGHVIRVDIEADGRAWERCLRVRVVVDIHKPLLRGKWIKVGKKKHWISFKYERLQNFCFQCAVLFHKGKDCTRLRPEHQGEKEAPQQFGLWLRVQPRNTNVFDSRRYGGSDDDKKQYGEQ
ncbi:uncharacterized protein LOC122293793 [Carya illinoinensis]|uniref:uncharacterized protein LOC122293793 n=1 Tax=Carya illinoinensis TaxID=32201 RepID=UPI001C72988B|nr:uncharacterized protein LOC122293793 [Carya illinoinensis]